MDQQNLHLFITAAIIWGIYHAMTSRQNGIFESTSRLHLMNTLFHVSMTNAVLSGKTKHFPFLLSSTPCCPPAVGAAFDAAVGAAIAVEIGADSFTLFWFGLHIGDLNLTLSSTSWASLRSTCSCGCQSFSYKSSGDWTRSWTKLTTQLNLVLLCSLHETPSCMIVGFVCHSAGIW